MIPDSPDAEQCRLAIEAIVSWARSRRDIRGAVLVGSRASGHARPDSDIDVVLLVDAPAAFRAETLWIEAIDWDAVGGRDPRWGDEDYGAFWSRRLWLRSGLEVEILFAGAQWADICPVDPGTRRVVGDGCAILYDPDGLLEALVRVVRGKSR